MWIGIAIVVLTFIFWIIGHEGVVKLKAQRPKHDPKRMPPVSVIIPAYKSDKTIGRVLESVKRMDYPKKEIIVVNDSDDKTPQICKKYGVKLIQNNKRMGKAVSLDMATKKAKNDLILFLDSDTMVDKNVLKKVVPWFQKPEIGVVMPTFTARNDKGMSGMVSIENIFTHSHLRTHLNFGSLISFRGCCFAIRKRLIKEAGGWGKTLTEDNDMGAKVVKRGHVIQWEPDTVASTDEPGTKDELMRQKVRWGVGSVYTFLHHAEYYIRSPQFLLYFLPYMVLGLGVGLLVLWHLYLAVVTLSLFPITVLIAHLIFISLTTYFHITVLVYSERGFINPLMLLKYIVYYLPLVNMFYLRGVLKGIKGKMNNEDELDLSLW